MNVPCLFIRRLGISDLGRPQSRTKISIARRVAATYRLQYEDLVGSNRAREFSEPRQEAMWLMWQVLKRDKSHVHSMASIGRFFGHADHTSARHGILQHERRLAQQERAA